MVEKAKDIYIEIKLWEPTAGQGTFVIGQNGSQKKEVIFSNLRGVVSGVEFLNDYLVACRLVDTIYGQLETTEGPCRKRLLHNFEADLQKRIIMPIKRV